MPPALGDGDCSHIVWRIEHRIEAVFRKQIEFHNSPRTSKRHKTVLKTLPLDGGRNPPTRQSAPSAIAEQFDWFLTGRVAATVASGAPEQRKRLREKFVNWNNGREALGRYDIKGTWQRDVAHRL